MYLKLSARSGVQLTLSALWVTAASHWKTNQKESTETGKAETTETATF